MNAPELLTTLSDRNVQLWVEGAQLRYRARKGVLTPELRDLLLQHKDEVICLLRQRARESISSHPLSKVQGGMWFINQAVPDSASYHIGFTARIRSSVDIPALKRVFQALMDRHPMLRTTYSADDGIPIQHVHGYMQAEVDEIDALRWDEEELREKVTEAFQCPFDLERGPLLRVHLFNRSEKDRVFVMVAHHIAVDGWSLWLLLDEVRKIYSLQTSGNPGSLPLPELKYTDYVHWQNEMIAGPEGKRLWAYWEKQFEGELTPLNLGGRPSQTIDLGRRAASHIFSLDLSSQIKSLARAEGVTLYTILLSVYLVLLYRYTGQEDILVVSPVSGRTRPEFERIVGCFVNPVLLRAVVRGDLTFRQLLSQTQNTVLGALEHQDYPLAVLNERLRPTGGFSRSALFQIGFALQKPQHSEDISALFGMGESPRMEFGGLELEPYNIPQGEGQAELVLEILEGRHLLWGILKYDTNIFTAATISRMEGHYRKLLESVIADPTRRPSELSLLTEPERRQLLGDWNETRTDYPRDKCFNRLFEEQVARTPDTIAVICAGRSLSYGDLNKRANLVADHLLGLGVQPDDIIGIYTDRSMDMVVGLLGIMKAGSAYTPLDTSLPEDRIEFMLEDSNSRILITQSQLKRNISFSGTIICIDAEWEKISRGKETNPETAVQPDSLVYVIYTSGSTGKPKGVQIAHRALVNFLYSMQKEPGLIQKDTVLSVTSMSFDIFGLELFLPLLFGAKVVIAERDDTLDGLRLADLIKEHNVSIMQATPSTWRLLIESGWSGHDSLKMICGGEAFPPDLVDPMLHRCKELWNLYGPTETTIWSTVFRVRSGEESILVGLPIANTQIYILDDSLQPLPIGLVGELHIGGDGLSRGYLNRPELTAEKFIPHPFNKDPGARIYKTGDLARYRPDGNIECLGRIDHQVKLRGFRIELGEIEARIKDVEAVANCVVVLREDRPGDKRLVAYYVAREGCSVSVSDVRSYLQSKLPEYMVPEHFAKLEAIPLTPNGKVDRKALPKPDIEKLSQEHYVAPETEIERAITAIWQQVLKLEKVGIHDNFFEVGGHSLLMAQVLSKVRELSGKDISMMALFQNPTIASLCKYLGGDQIEQSSFEQLYDRAKRQEETMMRRKELRKVRKESNE